MAYTTEFVWAGSALLIALLYVWYLSSDDEDRWKW